MTSMVTTATAMVSSSSRKSVAVIGGGVAGLSCAETLADAAFDVTVYDTGRLRPGGRCSSRFVGDRPKEGEEPATKSILSEFLYDHAAQIVTVPKEHFEKFEKQVQAWESQGVLKQFPANSVFDIRSPDNIKPHKSEALYYGAQGMGCISLAMVDRNRFDLRQDVWVSPSNGVKYLNHNQKWRVQAKGKVLGEYDQLVIAHNGKCADRLMSKTPAKDVHNLLRVNFAPSVAAHGGKRMTLNSIYSLTVCLDAAASKQLAACLPPSFVSGFVHNHRSLRFLSCASKKYKSSQTTDDDGDDNQQTMVWTILSSATFAKKYKAPQEFLPEERVEEVTTLLLQAVAEAVGAPSDFCSPQHVVDQRLQLWGAALPLNVWKSDDNTEKDGFLYDPRHGVGVCGDWLLEASIAGAWTSGKLLAEHMTTTADESVGLQGSFRRSESAAKVGIGALQ